MYRIIILYLLVLCLGCKNQITPSDIDLLNGYWNIEYITHKNETFYPKGATKLLDFYEVNKREGIRKKVQPQLDNKFLVTEDLNNFKIIFKDKYCYLSFQTVLDQWQEKIVELNENKLVLEHQDKRYNYKRFYSDY
tara:strand:- start:48706 stop:49113 length:408 start_codon:yes stop_codon:yes gene_type:complete